jgi:hypothetical protein
MANYIDMLNTIRANSSNQYQERVPEATRETFSEVGTSIMSYPNTKNDFLNSFVVEICMKEIKNTQYKNPLAVLKKGKIPYGGIVQETYTNPISAVTFDGSNTSDMLKVTKPDVKTSYFEKNRMDKYPVSISDAQLRDAFRGEAEFGAFHQSVLNALYSGDEMDEYLLMRNTVSSAIDGGKMKVVEVEDDATAFIKAVETTSRYMKYASKEFAGYNIENAEAITAGTLTPVTTWCPQDKQVLLIREDIDVETDIEVLAKAFNMDKANFKTRKIGIDTFADPDILAVLCDESIFKFYDNEYQLRSFDNGSNLTTNFWLHHWQTLGLSSFANAVAFKKAQN